MVVYVISFRENNSLAVFFFFFGAIEESKLVFERIVAQLNRNHLTFIILIYVVIKWGDSWKSTCYYEEILIVTEKQMYSITKCLICEH